MATTISRTSAAGLLESLAPPRHTEDHPAPLESDRCPSTIARAQSAPDLSDPQSDGALSDDGAPTIDSDGNVSNGDGGQMAGGLLGAHAPGRTAMVLALLVTGTGYLVNAGYVGSMDVAVAVFCTAVVWMLLPSTENNKDAAQGEEDTAQPEVPPSPAAPEAAVVHQVDEWVEPASELARGDPSLPRALDNKWREPMARKFKVRSARYFARKLKLPAERAPAFRPIGIQGYMRGEGAKRLRNLGAEVPSLAQHMASKPASYFLLVSWLIPGPPYISVMFAFERAVAIGEDPVLDRMMEEFVQGSDADRKARFKYLPSLDMAPRMVMSGMKLIGGEKPTMLCNKLDSRFYRGENYFEIEIDIASSKIANMVTGLILPKVKSVVVSSAFILQANHEEELPERILACNSCNGIRMYDNIVHLP